jgi:hypothetical protein
MKIFLIAAETGFPDACMCSPCFPDVFPSNCEIRMKSVKKKQGIR